MPASGTLYIVATPIGNLEDITFRAARILREAPHLFAEGSETAFKLLARLEIRKSVEVYTESRREAGAKKVLAYLARGEDVALISEAGTPGISDPGADLVERVRAAGHPIVPIPGPSALAVLLSVAGKGAERFLFEGYLPRKRGERIRALEALKGLDRPIVCFEAPHRLAETLQDLVQVFGGDRLAFLGRELTKLHEEVRRGTLAEHNAWAQAAPPRGEFTLLLQPGRDASQAIAPDEAAVLKRLTDLMKAGLPRSKAAARVAREMGVSRKFVYSLGLATDQDESVDRDESEEE